MKYPRIPRANKIKIKEAKIIANRSSLALLCVALGVLISAQWRSIPERVSNPVAPYVSLKETKDSLYEEQSELKTEISDLQKSIQEIQETSQDITLSKTQITDLNNKKAQAGLTKLNGTGIIAILDDSKSGPASEDSIVHAADIRDVVNLLWTSGAEGVAINGQRIVINSAIDCIVNTILVNNVRLSTPFRIEAIGNPLTLYSALNSESTLPDIYARKNNGLIFTLQRNNDITLPVFDGSFEINTKVSQ